MSHITFFARPRNFVLAIIGLSASIIANAAGTVAAMPSDAQISAERARIERERKPMFADPNLGRSAAGNAFPVIPTPPRAQLDPLAVAQRYAARAQSRKQEELLAFASLSMPAESLKRLVRDVARAGGAVVLRGFKDGSLKTTVSAIQALGVDASAVQVNPNAFKQYRITAVPAIVLVKADRALDLDAEGCSLPANFAGVTGDVTVTYALREIGRRSSDYQPLADRILASLGEH
ncbi:type-F conjugative transfer system pilin assembly protein TrbC [Burkholderia cenocepacia]|uniref:type-F conjugative transfer system pilin assembly protein TrbC n=1 Tax=Burkholderia cenocepacia TaxID=95486 RepID=UPI0024B79BEF|nr:type-F conjugative transfer system pilin assembly protein TrbC [Burkholderia cenocepacia]MDI9695362.1 type-F conjugative transfer system pilin assembly protein TrbC [Burkholderia cenocepacia]